MVALVPFDRRHLTKVKYHVWYAPIAIAIVIVIAIDYLALRFLFLTKIDNLVLLFQIYYMDILTIGDEINKTKRMML
jgi:hypothetical protein